MDRRAILEELKKVLEPYTEDKELLRNIDEHTDLVKDLKINSSNLVDVIIDAEAKYNIEIDFDSSEKMITVGSCIDVIEAKIEK
jgi:acyl carrier protein